MKFSTVAIIAVSAACAFAQGINDIPACAQTCLLTGIQATGCGLTDFKCSCSNDKFIKDSTTCIQGACGPDDVLKAAKATYELCKSVGITIPTQGPAPTSAAQTSSAAPAPSSSEAPVVSSSSKAASPTSMSEAVSTPSGYAPAPTSQAPVYTQVTGTLTNSVVISTTQVPAMNTTSPSVVQPSAPAYTGGASAVAGSMFLAVGGAVAAFFL